MTDEEIGKYQTFNALRVPKVAKNFEYDIELESDCTSIGYKEISKEAYDYWKSNPEGLDLSCGGFRNETPEYAKIIQKVYFVNSALPKFGIYDAQSISTIRGDVTTIRGVQSIDSINVAIFNSEENEIWAFDIKINASADMEINNFIDLNQESSNTYFGAYTYTTRIKRHRIYLKEELDPRKLKYTIIAVNRYFNFNLLDIQLRYDETPLKSLRLVSGNNSNWYVYQGLKDKSYTQIPPQYTDVL